jgi:hypothetical protein
MVMILMRMAQDDYYEAGADPQLCDGSGLFSSYRITHHVFALYC